MIDTCQLQNQAFANGGVLKKFNNISDRNILTKNIEQIG